MKDFKMPVAVITFLAAQAGGMVWFLSGLQSRVKALESFDSGIAVSYTHLTLPTILLV